MELTPVLNRIDFWFSPTHNPPGPQEHSHCLEAWELWPWVPTTFPGDELEKQEQRTFWVSLLCSNLPQTSGKRLNNHIAEQVFPPNTKLRGIKLQSWRATKQWGFQVILTEYSWERFAWLPPLYADISPAYSLGISWKQDWFVTFQDCSLAVFVLWNFRGRKSNSFGFSKFNPGFRSLQ